MPEEKWGVKRLCPSCATRFYDLQNDPMTCPSCGEEYDLATMLDGGAKAAREKAKAKEEAATAAAAEAVVDTNEDLLEDDAEPETSDDLLDDDEDDTVALEEIADVAANEDDS